MHWWNFLCMQSYQYMFSEYSENSTVDQSFLLLDAHLAVQEAFLPWITVTDTMAEQFKIPGPAGRLSTGEVFIKLNHPSLTYACIPRHCLLLLIRSSYYWYVIIIIGAWLCTACHDAPDYEQSLLRDSHIANYVCIFSGKQCNWPYFSSTSMDFRVTWLF